MSVSAWWKSLSKIMHFVSKIKNQIKNERGVNKIYKVYDVFVCHQWHTNSNHIAQEWHILKKQNTYLESENII